jgi:hypothetical protein
VCGRSPICVRWCNFRESSHVNDLLHISHIYGHSPQCLNWWAFRSLWVVNDVLHISHMFECFTLWCLFTILCCIQGLLQKQQRYGHSPSDVSWGSFEALCQKEMEKDIRLNLTRSMVSWYHTMK